MKTQHQHLAALFAELTGSKWFLLENKRRQQEDKPKWSDQKKLDICLDLTIQTSRGTMMFFLTAHPTKFYPVSVTKGLNERVYWCDDEGELMLFLLREPFLFSKQGAEA